MFSMPCDPCYEIHGIIHARSYELLKAMKKHAAYATYQVSLQFNWIVLMESIVLLFDYCACDMMTARPGLL